MTRGPPASRMLQRHGRQRAQRRRVGDPPFADRACMAAGVFALARSAALLQHDVQLRNRPQSDAGFVKGHPAETTEAFLDGYVSAFAFFGGVPLSILYDNTTIAVARICGDGKRERTAPLPSWSAITCSRTASGDGQGQ